jgi:gluconolactonase
LTPQLRLDAVPTRNWIPVVLSHRPTQTAAVLIAMFLLLAGQSTRAVRFEISDAVEFAKIIDTNAVLTTNATINAWLEGPVWVPSDGGYLLFCDQGNNKLKKLVPTNALSDFIAPPANTLYNGTVLDANERLLACQAGGAGLRIVMVTNGVVVPLASTSNGLKFYSPNDLTVKSDGTIWFTDPGYNGGVGNPPKAGFQGGYYVYRFDLADGNATCTPVITSGLSRPNGICFSPDESKVYVADTESSPRRIKVYDVMPDNTLSAGTVFATINNGNPDGIRSDVDGRIWSSAGDGVHIFAPDGHRIGKILFNRTANLCFGGPEYKTLYMTGQPVVTSLPVKVAGIPSVKKLTHEPTANGLKLSWPAPSTGFVLQSSGDPASTDSWTNAPVSLSTNGGFYELAVDATNTTGFFRLKLN